MINLPCLRWTNLTLHFLNNYKNQTINKDYNFVLATILLNTVVKFSKIQWPAQKETHYYFFEYKLRNSIYFDLFWYRMASLKVILRKFLEFHNPVPEELRIAFWKLTLTDDGPEQISKDVQAFEKLLTMVRNRKVTEV